MDSKYTREYDAIVQNKLLQPPTGLVGVENSSREAMEKGLNEFSASQGYKIVTKASYKQRNGHYTVH